MDFDDILNGETGMMRTTTGRSPEDVTISRRLKVLELYSDGLVHQIYPFIENMGFSRKTAQNDLEWAKNEWMALNSNVDSALEIIQRHTSKYYEFAARAETAGDLKMAKDMLQAIEKLRGFHNANVAVQVNTGFVQNNTTNTQNNWHLDALNLEELKNLQLLAAKIAPPMA